MKLGLFGGSFDPVHQGHLAPVRALRAELGLDRVLYLPTANPPHKPRRSSAPPLRRFAMVELALLHEPGLYASTHELTLGRPAYTVETVEHFRAEHSGDELFLVIGADAFAELHLWRRWQDLLAGVTTVVLARPGVEVPPPAAEWRADDGTAPRIVHLTNAPLEVSSTMLRAALARGERPTHLIPQPVLDYIEKYGLYR